MCPLRSYHLVVVNSMALLYQIQIIFISSTCEHCVLMLPFARSYHTATTVGSTVYLTGGQINDYDDEGNVIRGVYTKTCLKWNFETDQWIYTGDSLSNFILLFHVLTMYNHTFNT